MALFIDAVVKKLSSLKFGTVDRCILAKLPCQTGTSVPCGSILFSIHLFYTPFSSPLTPFLDAILSSSTAAILSNDVHSLQTNSFPASLSAWSMRSGHKHFLYPNSFSRLSLFSTLKLLADNERLAHYGEGRGCVSAAVHTHAYMREKNILAPAVFFFF